MKVVRKMKSPKSGKKSCKGCKVVKGGLFNKFFTGQA